MISAGGDRVTVHSRPSRGRGETSLGGFKFKFATGNQISKDGPKSLMPCTTKLGSKGKLVQLPIEVKCSVIFCTAEASSSTTTTRVGRAQSRRACDSTVTSPALCVLTPFSARIIEVGTDRQ
eukprot:1252103-Rhodomonas_salina.1